MTRRHAGPDGPALPIRPARPDVPLRPDGPAPPHRPRPPESLLDRLAAEGARPVRQPYSGEATGAVVNVKARAAAKAAFFELREELEVALGARLTQPEAFDLLVGFAAAPRRALVRSTGRE